MCRARFTHEVQASFADCAEARNISRTPQGSEFYLPSVTFFAPSQHGMMEIAFSHALYCPSVLQGPMM